MVVNMIIMGIAFSHNGAVTIINEGKVVIAIQAERITRKKRQALDLEDNLKALEDTIDYCLNNSLIDFKDINKIAYSTPW